MKKVVAVLVITLVALGVAFGAQNSKVILLHIEGMTCGSCATAVRRVLRKVDGVRKPGTIITTNTSGLPVGKIAEGFSDDFRRCWFGTHFFNPPRYMKPLELIPTADTDPEVFEGFRRFADRVLGKRVIRAKDTPGFISTRLGLYSLCRAIELAVAEGLTIEEVSRAGA